MIPQSSSTIACYCLLYGLLRTVWPEQAQKYVQERCAASHLQPPLFDHLQHQGLRFQVLTPAILCISISGGRGVSAYLQLAAWKWALPTFCTKAWVVGGNVLRSGAHWTRFLNIFFPTPELSLLTYLSYPHHNMGRKMEWLRQLHPTYMYQRIPIYRESIQPG